MKIRLLRDANVRHKAGEIVEIEDPAALHFLISTGSAVALRAEAPETPEQKAETTKRTTSRKKQA